MRATLKLPKLGDSVDEVVVIEVVVSVGSVVAAGDAVLVAETDKVDAEVPAPIGGRIVEILVQVGDEISTGHPFAVLEA